MKVLSLHRNIMSALKPAAKTNKKKISAKQLFFASLALLSIYGVLVIKAGSLAYSRPVLVIFAYSILITLFQLGRIIVVLFYEASLENSRNKTFVPAGKQDIRLTKYEPVVSFVIPCYNEAEAIEETVTRCFAVHYPANKIEVLAVDDGSSDNTPKILDRLKKKFPGLTVVKFAKNRGKRHAMVEGFRKAAGEIIVQLDSDSYVEAESFIKLIEPFKNPDLGAVCAHADPTNADKNIWTKMQSAYYYMSFRILKAVESTFNTVFCCSGCASAYRKSAVLPIIDEWCDEKFLGLPVMYGDDRSLTTRVIQGGFKTIYVWDAKAYTIVPETFRRLMIQQVRWKKSWIINAFKTGRFIIWKKPLVAILYFYPLILISLLNPFIAIYALIVAPALVHTVPISYLLGIFLITCYFVFYYRLVGPENRYWPYLFAWSALTVVVLSPMLIYAVARIQNRSWGTR